MRLLSSRRASPARGLSFVILLVAFPFASMLVGSSCSSTARNPATGMNSVVAPPAAPVGTADSEAATEGETESASARSGGLSEAEILALPPEAIATSDLLDIGSKSLEELNAEGYLEDVQFEYDSARLSPAMRTTLEQNADWLARYPSVRILVEGHCDERGTVEYNLALGEERARAVRDYLRDLGVGSGRMRIISYGKEFPLDPGRNEDAWRRNRRAHLEIIAK